MERPRSLPDEAPESGAPYWYWLGGRLALDFVNTLRERWNRRVECLVTAGDLGLWLQSASLLDNQPEVAHPLLTKARQLREAIDGCVEAAVAGVDLQAADVAIIDSWLARGEQRNRLVWTKGTVELAADPPPNPAAYALGRIAHDAARMLTEEPQRIRICASFTCSARFFDRSPPGRRRWCSMELCGNVDKARRHRARTRR